MKLQSSSILTVAALLVLSCATVGPKSPSVVNNPQMIAEQVLVCEIRYHLEDIYDYDAFFIIQPVIKQALLSGTEYYLKDIYDYDAAFLLSQHTLKQADDSRNLLDYFAILSIVDETPLTEPVPEQTLVSGIQYYLEDLYDYDDTFLVSQSVIKETAVPAIINETPFFITQPVPEQTLVSGRQYYLEDIYDYNEPTFVTNTSGTD